MEFKTENQAVFQKMIYSAVSDGLTFEASEKDGWYFIKYTGGY